MLSGLPRCRHWASAAFARLDKILLVILVGEAAVQLSFTTGCRLANNTCQPPSGRRTSAPFAIETDASAARGQWRRYRRCGFPGRCRAYKACRASLVGHDHFRLGKSKVATCVSASARPLLHVEPAAAAIHCSDNGRRKAITADRVGGFPPGHLATGIVPKTPVHKFPVIGGCGGPFHVPVERQRPCVGPHWNRYSTAQTRGTGAHVPIALFK